MKTQQTLSLWLSALALAALPLHGATYNHTADDTFAGVPGGGILDITSAFVSHTATNIIFQINLAGNPAATTWGKYMVAIHSEAGGDTAGDGWHRPIGMDVGMNYWLGSWVDSGTGVTLWHYTNNSWSAAPRAAAPSRSPARIGSIPRKMLASAPSSGTSANSW